MDKTPLEVWLQRIEAWKSSGMTAREFAATHGFDLKAFENRKYHLGLQARRKPGLMKHGNTGTGFVEVITTAAPRKSVSRTPTVAAKSFGEPFELHLRNGLTVKVPLRFDSNALRQLLWALESR
jgi:hypothetical protein